MYVFLLILELYIFELSDDNNEVDVIEFYLMIVKEMKDVSYK